MQKITLVLLVLWILELSSPGAAGKALKRTKRSPGGAGTDFIAFVPNSSTKTSLSDVPGLVKEIEIVDRWPETIAKTFIANNNFLPSELAKDLQVSDIRGSPYGTARITVKPGHEKYQGSILIRFRVPRTELRRKRKLL